NGLDLSKFPPCTDDAFVGKNCVTVGNNARDVKCDDVSITCGTPLLNTDDGTYCRAITCNGAGETCGRNPMDLEQYSCQLTECSIVSDSCATAAGNDDLEYRKCVCEKYGDKNAGALNVINANLSSIAHLPGTKLPRPGFDNINKGDEFTAAAAKML